jgi:competence protein ComEC
MFKLRVGYFITGIITGCIVLFTFLSQLPDGKLHIVFCDVGQGDAAYIRFPDGKDMVIDGGPASPYASQGGPGGQTPKVIGCLSRHMPLYDRQIDIVVLSHPQEDHLGGVLEILKRYQVSYFVHSDVTNTTEGFQQLMKYIADHHIPERIVGTGEFITLGKSHVSVVWPHSVLRQTQDFAGQASSNILGVSDVNDASVILHLRYGTFDAVFPGDADSHIDPELIQQPLDNPDGIEVLKVPHHGAKTGMTDGFFSWLGRINLAVISVGKNTYGHPAPETIARLEKDGADVLRTDQQGDIEVISDGKQWRVKTEK